MQWPAGVDRIEFDSIDSTNLEAKRRAGSTDAPLWILAGEQTAGVGRRGRAWSSQKGNFSATLLMPISENLSTVALRSFVASLALYDTLVETTKTPERFSLKWPNDVLCDGRKLAGILLETCGVGPSHLCVGIGVNIAQAPEVDKIKDHSTAPTALDETISPSQFLDALAPCYAEREAQFLQSGFTSIRNDWLKHAARLGETITARTPKLEITGKFLTVDEQGAVVIQEEQTTHTITAADIFF